MSHTYLPFRPAHSLTQPLCGCWYPSPMPNAPGPVIRSYLPLDSTKAHTVVKDVASRTVLTQTFSNRSTEPREDISYSFPLYDGVSVVSFTATIGDVKIHGTVKEKQQARRDYDHAVSKGSLAGLLEQLPEASDIFITRIGNVPAGASVIVEVTYIGELRHDAGSNGIRFTIPTSIAPRYGATPDGMVTSAAAKTADTIQVVVDFQSPEGCPIQQIQSPSHPIAVTVGRTTEMPAAAFLANRGSATLSLDTTTLDKDFVVIASIKDADIPKALLETHDTFSNQRALMATLVPRFNIAPTYGEIVFIVDRSGSMQGKMDMVIKATTILLKSLPVGTKFNICSFGSRHSFLWPRSKSYNDKNLEEALKHIDTFAANFGGTEMYQPVKDTITQRFSDMMLDVIMLTDGQIYNQDTLFDLIRKSSDDNKCRFFSLGIGSGASTALVEGISTAGKGLSQFVAEGEKMDMKMVRLLKGALTPHIDDYSLEVKYKQDDEDFEIIESSKTASQVDVALPTTSADETASKPPISFFDNTIDPDDNGKATITSTKTENDKFAHLPIISPPSILQAPCRVPPLFPFSRTTVYLLLDPSTYHRTPEAVILRATCSQGPLELEMKVEDVGKGETIHQLAAKKAVSEIEKTGGWLADATDKADGALIKSKYDGRWEELVEREAVRLGVKYQIAGKWCSFVAVGADVEHEAAVVSKKMLSPPEGSHSIMRLSSTAGPNPFSSSRALRAPAPAVVSGGMERVRVKHRSLARGRQQSPEAFIAPASQAQFESLRRQDYARPVPSSSRPPPPPPASRIGGGASVLDSFLALSSPAPPSFDSDDDKMHEVIRLQKSDGSWVWDQRLLNILGTSIASEKRDAIVATALAIAFLQNRMAHEAASWELIVEKARSWLSQQPGVDAEKEISNAGKLLAT